MAMTTPPGWYPDQHVPSTERWWDGTAWTAHTRPLGASPASSATARPPAGPAAGEPVGGGAVRGGGGRKRLITILAAGLAAAAVITAAALGFGGDRGDAKPLAARSGTPSPATTPEPGEGTPDEEPEAEAGEDPTRLTDQLNGITLPIPDGWERPDSAGDSLTIHTATTYTCPGAPSMTCRQGTVSSGTVSGTDETSPEALAKEDIAKAADEAFADIDYPGFSTHGDITSHTVIRSRSAVVAGRTGYLVRWKVITGVGSGGYVQSLVFPSTIGNGTPVRVRTAFSAGPGGPPLTLMDTITEGIRPLGDVSGGVGSSIGP
ncbi:DUF2510 domain-containing protein [Streptomyces sp. NPDC050509]|uniref:DUF2510 domain-containing protein n=1 Tax=Streptomyces sp. NPDC050509 TaxID=3365620 RepID=UPI0037A6B6C6